MTPRMNFVILACASALAFGTSPALAADLAELPHLNAAPTESSVSGISSGAFMAVQFGTAWSSIVKGVGVVSGGPYNCAQGEATTAIGPCMKGPVPELKTFLDAASENAASEDIDPLINLASQKVYIFHGYNDAVVARPVADAAAAFYRHYEAEAGRGNLFYQTSIGAGHSFVVLHGSPEQAPKLNGCKDNRDPYIDQCDYDQAGILLQHIYGALSPRNAGALNGSVKSFSQTAYMDGETPEAVNMAPEGYVFVPKDCEAGAACRVHIALHGCKQTSQLIGRTFVDNTGYLNWADTNRIVVLFPQTQATKVNPAACWDWWGYSGSDEDYATKSGKQIKVIKAMLDALTSGTKPEAAPVGQQAAADGVSFNLAVTDVSDTGAALSWAAIPGATGYRVTRIAVDGTQVPAGTVTAPSFGDMGLTAATGYRWRVSAVIGGAEGPVSSEVAATTRATPAPCATPGMCPLVQSANSAN